MADINIRLAEDLNLSDLNRYFEDLTNLNEQYKHLIREVYISVKNESIKARRTEWEPKQ